jgi:SPP1 family holin
MRMDKGTIIRTVLLFISLVNQILILAGKPIIPVTETDLNTVYVAGSAVFSFVMTLVVWFKNNYITKKGLEQKEVLKKNGLT